MKLLLFGYGNMGRLVESLAQSQGHTIVGKRSRTSLSEKDFELADVCLDFSHASCVYEHALMATRLQKPLVIGTTGWEAEQDKVKDLILQSGNAALYASNFSIGIAIFTKLVTLAGQLTDRLDQYDVAGIEVHHIKKADSPSGTAKHLAHCFGKKLQFTSLRTGYHPGTHSIILDSAEDSIVLTHQARNRIAFAKGALTAAGWILNKKGWFTLDDMLRTLDSTHHTFH